MTLRVLLAGGVYRMSQGEFEGQQPTPEIVLSEGLTARGIEVDNFPLERIGKIAFARTYDVVHVHHLSRAAVAASMAPWRIPLVFTAHSAAYPQDPLQRLGLSVVSRRMAAGICLSQAESQLRAKWYPSSAPRLHVIANGLALPDQEARVRTYDGQQLRGLFVGQLIDVKQVHLILDALTRIPQLELRLVYHNDELEGDLRRRVRDLRIESRVTFVGQRSGEALFDEYRAAHALLLPSKSEALPSVVTEALSTGLPVIASDVGGVASQVGWAGILIDPSSSAALTNALGNLAAEYSVFAVAAAARAAEVRRRFSVGEMVGQHISLYESLV